MHLLHLVQSFNQVILTKLCFKWRDFFSSLHIHPASTLAYSTVTDFAKFLGLSTSQPFCTAM